MLHNRAHPCPRVPARETLHYLLKHQVRQSNRHVAVGSRTAGSGHDVPASNSSHERPDQPKMSKWQSMQAMVKSQGPGAFFAYITVSNTLSVTLLSSAWLLFTRSTGTSPLQAWPQFLACYAGVWAAQHLARPWKIALGLAATPLGTAAVTAASRAFTVTSGTALVLLLIMEAAALLCCLGCVVLYASSIV